MSEHFDAVVIGTGQAAPALCARLDKEGVRTALVERKLLGGTCVNVGCIPTKTLVASARAVHMARRGREYGFQTGEIRVEMPAVKARKDGVVNESRGMLEKWIGAMKNVTLIRGARALYRAARRGGGREGDRGRPGVSQRRRAGAASAHAGHQGRSGSYQQHDPRADGGA
jgi:pyruvate/2-oxoglutarate dehydrogenase complex dihydrolipoamide dehydrogenase (E3) component